MTEIILSGLTVDDLIEKLSLVLNEKIKTMAHPPPISEQPEYYTREEAAKILRITLPTLRAHTKIGKVKGCRIGGRVLYRHDDLDKAVKEIKPWKK